MNPRCEPISIAFIAVDTTGVRRYPLTESISTAPKVHAVVHSQVHRTSRCVVRYPMACLTCVIVPTACVPQSQRQCCRSNPQSTLNSVPRHSALVRSHSSYSRRPTQRMLHRVSCSAGDFEEGELIKGIKAGDKLKVKESRVVYHAPKHKVG